jgi:predicted SAM-dependent methyltransferase
MEKSKKFLNIGCGSTILPSPFLNIDGRNLPGVDKVCDLFPLDFADSQFDLIYCSHVLEHFKKVQLKDVLCEWVRCLKDGGIMRISVPDIGALLKIYDMDGDLDKIIGPLLGGQDYPQNFHYAAFDFDTLKSLMLDCGLEAVHRWNPRRTFHSEYWDFSQAVTNEIPISLNLQGFKKSEYFSEDLDMIFGKLRESCIHGNEKEVRNKLNKIIKELPTSNAS